MPAWSPSTWSRYDNQQSVNYPDLDELTHVIQQLNQLPPLVTPLEINQLKHNIAKAGRGETFLLQGGDCAESFEDCRLSIIQNKLKLLSNMNAILQQHMRKPIVSIGRIAGQYAKPRSCDLETRQGVSLPSYRGDLINSPVFNATAREPRPHLLLQGYDCASQTLDMLRTLLQKRPQNQAFFTSHEALHLHYEQALTRFNPHEQRWYNLSTHLPWIGMRTAHIDSAHVELLRGVDNPIGIKIGPQATPAWLCAVIRRLNPKQEAGRILLISRMGADAIHTHLPRLIRAVQASPIPVTWSCDPMHGNTTITTHGIKTRHFDAILQELQQALHIHKAEGSHLGGVHFELTGEPVTECMGGPSNLSEADLAHAYHSLVDPRLNHEQSLEMAQLFGQSFSLAYDVQGSIYAPHPPTLRRDQVAHPA